MTLEAGTRIADYILRGELRHEDLCVVYEAVHLVLPRKAAMKVMHDGLHRGAAIQMLREACILEALSHPGVPRVFECGMLPDKRPWIAGELVGGRALSEELAEGPLAPPDVLPIVRALADVLAHAHARGVVHGAVSEIVVTRTPDRASPVCLRGWSDVAMQDGSRDVDPSDDIHALGALAFRAITGSAVISDDAGRLIAQHVPAETADLLTSMLATAAIQRPNAVEVRDRANRLVDLPPPRPPRIPRERLTTINDDPDVQVRIKR